jgi:hypothetical protein
MRLLVIAFVSAWLTASEAAAQDGPNSWWSHNGSVVELRAQGNARVFSYAIPRQGLPAQPGDTLFHGRRSGSSYSGTAYLFSSRCGVIGYSVSGFVSANQRKVQLRGRAPRRDANCRIVSYSADVLTFEFIPNPELW